MTRYTPAEILTAGLNDTRETFADLYVELGQLRATAAYYYHLAFVDHDVDGCNDRRLPFHPAPAGFGGNELAIPARRVNLAGLTDAGLQLYTVGVRTAIAEREQLLEQIDLAARDIERMLDAIDGIPAAIAKDVAHAIDVATHRANHTPTSDEVTGWDVPVRIPGTTTYISGETAS